MTVGLTTRGDYQQQGTLATADDNSNGIAQADAHTTSERGQRGNAKAARVESSIQADTMSESAEVGTARTVNKSTPSTEEEDFFLTVFSHELSAVTVTVFNVAVLNAQDAPT